ncbi:hypothetical protein QWY99_13540 [Flavobacterium branchiarum]|uniref:Antitoxin ParD1/3/4 n=1 Tax=Flavobacterium branchiarum TaxID=1114870 RepID=A0ABV5FI31_9FLAO|nr:hypothetical protein [Flavobacterium branchiarum]MDN3674079.1 hypothetical protein [Flavobacterium branchiarum]
MENKMSKSLSNGLQDSIDDNVLNLLRNEIQKGINSGQVEDFNPIEYLKKIKTQRETKS